MVTIWHHIVNVHDHLHNQFGDALYYAIVFVGILAVMAQYRLYEKAGQPGWTALVPILNFIVFLRIVGRPAKHLWLFLIPFYGQFYMLPKVWIEICQSFGKRTTLDYVLVVLLNGLYILNMGLDYNTRYIGPIYGKAPLPKPHKLTPRPQAA